MRLSVVLPVFNEAENLQPLHDRLVNTLDRVGCDYELIFVDDGSRDHSLGVMERLARENSRVRFLSLSRNFGHEIASSAGLHACDGDAVILMDADLQDPPELIEQLIEAWLQGFDVVYAQRVSRLGEGWLKRLTSYLFYRAMRLVASIELPLDTGDFRLMDRRVVDAFCRFSERHRFVRGLVTWMGFRQTAVRYVRSARNAGVGKYTAGKLLRLAVDAVLGYSVVPLRLISLIGLVCLLAVPLIGVAALARPAAFHTELAAALLRSLPIAFFSGAQLLAIGVLGEYVGKVFQEVQNRPLYLIDRSGGWPDSAERRGDLPESGRRRVRQARTITPPTRASGAVRSRRREPDPAVATDCEPT